MTAVLAESQTGARDNKLRIVLHNPLVTIVLIVLLSVWTSYTLYRLKFGNLSGADLSFAYKWEGVVLLVPLPGVLAAAFGYLTGSRLRALAIGLFPYAPLLALGYPLAALFFVLGIPMGLFGLSTAIFRSQKRLTTGALLSFVIGASAWLLLIAGVMR